MPNGARDVLCRRKNNKNKNNYVLLGKDEVVRRIKEDESQTKEYAVFQLNLSNDEFLLSVDMFEEAGEASKKPIELKIEQTNKEITDLEKSLKAQNVEIGANEIVRTTAVAQKAMEELNQAMIETEIKKETKNAIIESTIKNVTREQEK